jgi:hypothetical protein
VSHQRTAFKSGRLSPDRIARLETLGFEWDPFEADWEESFQEMVTFKTDHGHCRVSGASKSHKALGNWVKTQRTHYSKGKLSPERISKLEALGFEWAPQMRGLGAKNKT